MNWFISLVTIDIYIIDLSTIIPGEIAAIFTLSFSGNSPGSWQSDHRQEERVKVAPNLPIRRLVKFPGTVPGLVNIQHSYWTWPSRNSEFSHWKRGFSIVVLVYQRVDLKICSIYCFCLLFLGIKTYEIPYFRVMKLHSVNFAVHKVPGFWAQSVPAFLHSSLSKMSYPLALVFAEVSLKIPNDLGCFHKPPLRVPMLYASVSSVGIVFES